MPGLHGALCDEGRTAGLALAHASKLPWLTGRGHLSPAVQEKAPAHVINALARMHSDLGGDAEALANKRPGNPPTPDLIHLGSGCLIEVDEVQHFTSARLRTFDFYPREVPLGFDVDEYRELIELWRSKGDRAYAHKTSVDFPKPGGRQAQRAYNDALRDLLGPTFTGHPVIRLPVPGRALDGIIVRLRSSLEGLS